MLEVLIFLMRNALRFRKLAQALMLVLTGWLTYRSMGVVDGSEFVSGTQTGPILRMCDFSLIVFAVALVLAYPFPRVASVLALLASLLSLPFMLYFIAPGPYRAVFRGEYSVPLQSNFSWDRWILEPAIAILLLMLISVWNLFSISRDNVEGSATS
jgi:hypothetical protein